MELLGQVRASWGFRLVGYVIMPERVHRLRSQICVDTARRLRAYHHSGEQALGWVPRGSGFETRGFFGSFSSVPKNLKRYHGLGHLHFVTFSCHRRMALLAIVRARNAFCRALEQVHRKYDFALVGYVVMPEHVHLLIGEPKRGNPSTVVHSLKLRVSKRMRRRRTVFGSQRSFVFPGATLPRFWQPRFYDFNVWSAKKRREKLEYMHRNPVTRGLVRDPKDWVWSSYSSYSKRGTPLLPIDLVD